MSSPIAIALVCFGVIAWFRPRLALGVLLFLIPFGHLARLNLAMPNFGGLARFAVAGTPFTFPEAAVYVLAGVLLVRLCCSRGHCERAVGERGNPGFRTHTSGLLRSLRFLATTTWTRDPWIILPLLWILITALAAWDSPAGMRAWGIWKAYFVAPVMLFWMMRALTRPPLPPAPPSPRGGEGGYGVAGFRTIIFALAFGAFVVAVIAIVQRWFPIGVPYPWSLPGKFRATSVFGYPNAVGLYLAPLIPLFVDAALRFRSSFRASSEKSHTVVGTNNGVRPLAEPALSRVEWGLGMTISFVGVALLSLLAIILAKSTGALVALVVIAIVFPPFFLRSMRRSAGALAGDAARGSSTARSVRARWGRATAGPASAVVIAAWIALSLFFTAWLPYRPEQKRWGPPIIQKLTFQQWSGTVRLAQYRETWALLRDHPIRGAGLAGYQQAIRPYHEDQRVEIFLYPHNLLLAVWTELGLPGLFVFLAILFQFFRKFFSPPPTGRGSERGWGWYGIVAAMLIILIHGLVDAPYFKNDLAAVFWAIVALATAIARRARDEHAPRVSV